MKNKNSLDDLFKKNLFEYESEPNTKEWERINNSLDKLPINKGKNIVYNSIYVIVSVTAMVATLSYFIYFKNTGNKTSLTEKVVEVHENVAIVIADTSNKKNALATKEIVDSTNASSPKSATPIVVKSFSEIKDLVLPDGNTITLNKNTSVAYNSDFLKNKTLEIEGEVYFDLVENKNSPLYIISGKDKIEALNGTFIFNTKATDRGKEIYVIKNEVTYNGSEKTIIKQNQKGIINNKTSLNVAKINDVNFDSWKTRIIVFDNTKIKDVISTLGKVYSIPILTSNNSIYNCRFTGTFEESNLEEILDVLALTFDLTYNKEQESFILKGKGCN